MKYNTNCQELFLVGIDFNFYTVLYLHKLCTHPHKLCSSIFEKTQSRTWGGAARPLRTFWSINRPPL